MEGTFDDNLIFDVCVCVFHVLHVHTSQLRVSRKSGQLCTSLLCAKKVVIGLPSIAGCVRAPLLRIPSADFVVFAGADLQAFCLLGSSSGESIGLGWRVRFRIQTQVLRVLRNSQGSPPFEKGKGQGRDGASPSYDHEN